MVVFRDDEQVHVGGIQRVLDVVFALVGIHVDYAQDVVVQRDTNQESSEVIYY